ncbi:MAG TPA: hypothetical protein VLE96_00925 [Chlamydiales bacterium]|nr:hypothetical protein [Chlamydiales bacterium]
MDTKLKESEWIFVISILLVMLSIVIVAKINAKRTASALAAHPLPTHELCKVEIEGEVSKPGTYLVMPGTTVKKIIKKSLPTPFADLKKINPEQRIEQSMKITIDSLSEIMITIGGKQIFVPAGTKVCQLKKYIDTGDHKIFKSRRLLKDQEVILLEKI